MNPTEHWQPDSYHFIVDPFPHYEQLRKHSNVFNSPSGDYVLLSYDDVRSALVEKNFESGVRTHWMDKAVSYAEKKGKDYSPISMAMKSMLLQFNPPEHTEIRTFLSKNWPSKDELTAKAEETAKRLIMDLPKQGNLVDLLSRRLPLLVISEVLGTVGFQSDEFINDGIQVLRTLDPYLTVKDLETINSSSIRLYHAFDLFYNELDPKHENLSSKIKTYHAETDLTFDPVSLILFLFIAGLETTSSLISSILNLLLNNPALVEQLDSERRIDNFIHESLRLHSPVQLTGRINRNEVDIGGVNIPSGSVITLCIGAANRDPDQFKNPSEINLERDQHHQLGFGYGIHHCLGNQMALIESNTLVRNILPILPKMKLLEEAKYDTRLSLRNIHSLKAKINVR